MAYSSFDDKAHQPESSELEAALGDSIGLWLELISNLESQFDPLSRDWVFSGQKWRCALRLKHKKRAVLYMTPTEGCFRIGLALGEKAARAAAQSDLPAVLLQIIDNAQKYAEGRAVRFDVRTPQKVADAPQLASIKMAN